MEPYKDKRSRSPIPIEVLRKNSKIWRRKDVLYVASFTLPEQCLKLPKEPLPMESAKMYSAFAKRFKSNQEEGKKLFFMGNEFETS